MKTFKNLILVMITALAVPAGTAFAAESPAEEFYTETPMETDARAGVGLFSDMEAENEEEKNEEEKDEARAGEPEEALSEQPAGSRGEGSFEAGEETSSEAWYEEDVIEELFVDEAEGGFPVDEFYGEDEFEEMSEYDLPGADAFEESEEEMADGTGTHSHNDITFTVWNKNNELPSAAGNYYLSQDVQIDSTWTISDGQTINLCLHDHSIRFTGDSGSVILVTGGGALNLYDCEQSQHRYEIKDGLAKLDENGSESFDGGCITGGKGRRHSVYVSGGGIFVSGGSVTMYGGTVIGNQVSNYGGGFFLESGSLLIKNGNVIGNRAKNGAGICMFHRVSLSMENGIICHNHALDSAGGVHVLNGSFTMTGGQITENSAGKSGGGAYVNYSGFSQMFVSGSPVITGNIGPSGDDNVCLNERPEGPACLTVNGELTQDARIGVSGLYGPVRIIGFKDKMQGKDPSLFFFSDDPAYIVGTNSEGEPELKKMAASVTAGTVTTKYPTIGEALSAWQNDSTLTLLGDAEVSNTILVDGKTAALDLNGHGIRMAREFNKDSSDTQYSVIKVTGGGNLTLTDSGPDAVHHYTVDSGLAVVNDGKGGTTFYGGYITGGKGEWVTYTGHTNFYGGGVFIHNGSVTMNGGTIIGNSVSMLVAGSSSQSNGGGGVSIGAPEQNCAASFILNGGSIIGNTAAGLGAGVYVSGSGCSFEMNGGSIMNNSAGSSGGGVRMQPGGSFTMTDGSISGNLVSGTGGGVYTAGTFAMSGGSITGNAATVGSDPFTYGKGGGIYADPVGTFRVSGNCAVQNNQKDQAAVSNVCLAGGSSSALITVSGQLHTDARIGVNMDDPGVFTSGFNTQMPGAVPYAYFTSDDSPAYVVSKNSNGEAGLAVTAASVTVGAGSQAVTAFYGTLAEALGEWVPAGSTLTLCKDLTTDKTIMVPSGAHTLDLNGYGLRYVPSDANADDQERSVITLPHCDADRAELTIADSRPEAPHKYSMNSDRLAVVDDTRGTLEFTGGYITGGKGTRSSKAEPDGSFGGGIYIKEGSAVMNGGTIIGNECLFHGAIVGTGGGVCVGHTIGAYEGSFALNAGRIIGNRAASGGGLYVSFLGSARMADGMVGENYAGSGGGVFVSSVSYMEGFTMSGGRILGNLAAREGGGVFNNGTFTMSGGEISGNSVRSKRTPVLGGGVFNTGTFAMSGGEISGNWVSAENRDALGGGVYEHIGAGFILSGSPVIRDNLAEEGESSSKSNVFLPFASGKDRQSLITVSSGPESGAVVGISMEQPGVFTDGYASGADPSAIFFSDLAAYEVAGTAGSGRIEAMLRKPLSSISVIPSAVRSFADGTGKNLAGSDGKAEGGTLVYALGDSSGPAEPYSEAIPQKAGTGIYYVWVKAAGDAGHSDSEAVRVTSRLCFPVIFRVEGGAWDDGTTGEKKVSLSRYDYSDSALVLKAEDIPAVGSRPAGGRKGGSWDAVPAPGTVIAKETVFTYTYAPDTPPAKVKPVFALKDGFGLSCRGDKLVVSWGRVEGADSYEVYLQYCGEHRCRKVRTAAGTKTGVSLTKLFGEKPDMTKCFKVYVAAVRDGKRIARTGLAHVTGSRNSEYTDIKKIKLSRSSYTLAVGQTKKLKPKAVLRDREKKECPPKEHGMARFTYASTDSSVARVSQNGKITAVGRGSCRIWIYAMSGASKKVEVVVR